MLIVGAALEAANSALLGLCNEVLHARKSSIHHRGARPGQGCKAMNQADASGSFEDRRQQCVRFWDALKAAASFCILHRPSVWNAQAVCAAHCREAEGRGGGRSDGSLPAPGPCPCTAPDSTPGRQAEPCQSLCSGSCYSNPP